MKSIFAFLALLVSSALSAQTRYAAPITVENPPYGLVAQLWNASTSTVYLDSVSVSAAPVLPLLRGSNATLPVSFLWFAIGLSNLEENQCTLNNALVMGGNSAVAAPVGVRITKQPCTPNGRPYGQPNGNGTWNYTPTNYITVEFCSDTHCWLDASGGSIAIPPGTGATVYTAAYDGLNGFGWNGYAYVNIRYHDHVGCPAQSTNALCIQ